MKANKNYYLNYRDLFLSMGYNQEVKQLDNHFEIVLIYDNRGHLKFIK
tara:strand:+ start:2753 stop:2896 length:144 start_codon:yes stop_codon:yes gene_type:complete